MSLRRFDRAPYHILSAMLAQDMEGTGKLGAHGAAKVQLLHPRSKSWLFSDSVRFGQYLACAGLIPVSPHGCRPRFEAWFTCWPDAAPHMLSFVRWAQLTLRETAHDATVQARVRPGWRPGEKLAALIGFKKSGEAGLWEWTA